MPWFLISIILIIILAALIAFNWRHDFAAGSVLSDHIVKEISEQSDQLFIDDIKKFIDDFVVIVKNCIVEHTYFNEPTELNKACDDMMQVKRSINRMANKCTKDVLTNLVNNSLTEITVALGRAIRSVAPSSNGTDPEDYMPKFLKLITIYYTIIRRVGDLRYLEFDKSAHTGMNIILKKWLSAYDDVLDEDRDYIVSSTIDGVGIDYDRCQFICKVFEEEFELYLMLLAQIKFGYTTTPHGIKTINKLMANSSRYDKNNRYVAPAERRRAMV